MRLGLAGKGVEVNHPPRGMRCARGSAPGPHPAPRATGPPQSSPFLRHSSRFARLVPFQSLPRPQAHHPKNQREDNSTTKSDAAL